MELALQNNIYNLNLFWQSLNATKEKNLYSHTSWPNKQWCADLLLPSNLSLTKLGDNQTFCTVSEVIEPALEAFAIKSQLAVMNLNIKGKKNAQDVINLSNVEIVKINDKQGVIDWTKACSLAFDYKIDSAIIELLLTDSNASILALIIDRKIAGTAIGYQTDHILGIHQVGTLPQCRKMGVAVSLMQYLIEFATQQNCEIVSLQASKAGLPMYKKLGFNSYGLLTGLVNQ